MDLRPQLLPHSFPDLSGIETGDAFAGDFVGDVLEEEPEAPDHGIEGFVLPQEGAEGVALPEPADGAFDAVVVEEELDGEDQAPDEVGHPHHHVARLHAVEGDGHRQEKGHEEGEGVEPHRRDDDHDGKDEEQGAEHHDRLDVALLLGEGGAAPGPGEEEQKSGDDADDEIEMLSFHRKDLCDETD